MMRLSPERRVELQLEAWKATVGVQQHFNDIELKVRGLALTVISAVIGAAVLALRDGTTVDLFGVEWKLATLVLLVAIVIWRAFYQVDQIWYHRLLLGSVQHGETLEKLLADEVPGIGLAQRIREESPYKFERLGVAGPHLRKRNAKRWDWTQTTIRSSDKLRRFYWTITLLLVVFAVGVQLGGVKIAIAEPEPAPVFFSTTSTSSTIGTAEFPTTAPASG